jgi:hypothetical protein
MPPAPLDELLEELLDAPPAPLDELSLDVDDVGGVVSLDEEHARSTADASSQLRRTAREYTLSGGRLASSATCTAGAAAPQPSSLREAEGGRALGEGRLRPHRN